MSKSLSIGVLCFYFSMSGANAASTELPSFSYFGVGGEYIVYEEVISIKGGKVPLNTSLETVNPIQRGGGYTSIDSSLGFYITAASTQIGNPSEETWSSNSGVIQTNQAYFNWVESNFLLSYQIGKPHQVLAGISYTNLSFNRFDFDRGPDAAQFEAELLLADPTGDPIDNLLGLPGCNKDEVLNGTCLHSDSAVTEEVSSTSLMAGYSYNSLFASPDDKVSYRFSVLAGLPAYYRVLNSNHPNTRIVRIFDAGYDLFADAGITYKMWKQFSLEASLAFNYKYRAAYSLKNINLPENTIMSVRPALSLLWTF